MQEEYNLDYLYHLAEIPNGIDTAANPAAPPQPDSNPNPNEIINIVDEAGVAETAVNGQVNGEAAVVAQHPQEQQQQQLQQQQAVLLEQPKLYDMDLEKMHDELYRGRYLTPQDFLDDVAKMLRNAQSRANEDVDRLHKAQAMYTFAEVSILEFDAALRTECERMAVRERKRRAERRKNRNKSKDQVQEDGIQQNGSYMTTRRSARANGLEPELRITDPVQLERRLKRQRSECGDVAMDSHGSEEGEGEVREPKRVKHVSGDLDDDRDPLNFLGPSSNQSPRQTQPPHHHVRFAPDEVIESSSAPTPQPGEPGVVNSVVEPDAAVSVSPRKPGGFDPSLLNPVSPSEDAFQASNQVVNGIPAQPVQDIDPSNPFFPPPPREASQPSLMSVDGQSQSQLPGMDIDAGQFNASLGGQGEQVPREEQPSQEPMVVERTPTPLPDFHVNVGLLDELRHCLADGTASLTVEQLEQLRATCLGSAWRYRKDWNRYELLRELLGVVREFVEEVTEVWACDED